MGLFGRSRAHTTSEISRPVLTYSDAAPRADLRSLEKTHSPSPSATRIRISTTRSKSENGRFWSQPTEQRNVVQEFDFTVTQPPDDPCEQHAAPAGLDDGGNLDVNVIGIALGSPSMVPPPVYRPVDWSNASSPLLKKQTVTPTGREPGHIDRKPSKWKMIGGMLKGKHQSEWKKAREEFYQFRGNQSQGESSYSTLPRQQQKLQQDQWPMQDYEEHTPRASSRLSDRWPEISQENESLLKVDIPKVEMERYSIMFRSVLGEKPSSNLLARRSRALNQLFVNGKESGLQEPYIPKRRATSPSTSGPSLGYLFEDGSTTSLSNEPSKSQDNAMKPRSPIRSNTFPRIVAKLDSSDNHLTVPEFTPALSSGTFSEYSSAEPSPVPIDGTIALVGGNRNNEPEWEMVTTNKPSFVTPEKIKTLEIKPLATRSASSSTKMPLTHSSTNDTKTESPVTNRPLPPRTVSLPGSTNMPNVISRRNTTQTSSMREEDKTRNNFSNSHNLHNLVVQSSTTPSSRTRRSQTMPPVPLKINKRTSSTTGGNVRPPFTPIPERSPSISSPKETNQLRASQSSKPSMEVSIARSIPVSRHMIPRQTLVPLGPPHPHTFFHSSENERYGELKQKKVPVVIDVSLADDSRRDEMRYSRGHARIASTGLIVKSGIHRYQKSQDIVIESTEV